MLTLEKTKPESIAHIISVTMQMFNMLNRREFTCVRCKDTLIEQWLIGEIALPIKLDCERYVEIIPIKHYDNPPYIM